MRAAVGIAILTTVAAAASGPVPVKTSSRNEVTPTAGGEYFVWAKSRRGRPNVYDVWAQRGTEAPFKVNAPKTRGWAGGIDGTRLAFQQVKDGWKSDIRLFDLVTRRRSSPRGDVNTRRWEWAPTLSGDWLLFGRGIILRDSLQQVILQNLVTQEKIVLDSLRSKSGSLEAGQVNGNYAVWGRCASQFPGCDVFRYDIAARTKTPMPQTGHTLYGASVTPSGTTYYGRRLSRFCGDNAELVKTTIDGATEVLHAFPPGQDLTVSFAHALPPRPPTGVERVNVYFDRMLCMVRPRFDIFSTQDIGGPGPPPPPP